MNTATLNPLKDPMGAAIAEYQHTGKADKLRVLSSMFDEDEIDVSYLFRDFGHMPEIERRALELAREHGGHVLDVGAGAGCHALALQDKLKVTAIDISSLCEQVMKERGVKDARCINLYDFRLEGSFDTILMLMNGTGIVGNMMNMSYFFLRMRNLLAHGGQILIDSSDLKYLYDNGDGTYDFDSSQGYYGQIDYQMQYRDVRGSKFDWLYVDFDTLRLVAAANGFKCEKVVEGPHFDYLARLSLK
ncbi:MAG: methyltransferase domain-containing protein [Bacteroidales bacterium]|nr:methyltransferase domain-containing protein [Bacteroidales bacterium]